MQSILSLWRARLKKFKGLLSSLLGINLLYWFIRGVFEEWLFGHLLQGDIMNIQWLFILVIPVTISGILIWTYFEARREQRFKKPKIQLNPLHSHILDKKGNIVGIERIYDMLITTWDCPKYKTLTAKLNPICYQGVKEPSQILLSPPITIFRMNNVKRSVYTREDAFLFQSTTKQMTIANQCQIKLKDGIDYETSLEIKDDKHTLETINYLIELKQRTNSIMDLVIEEFEELEAGVE